MTQHPTDPSPAGPNLDAITIWQSSANQHRYSLPVENNDPAPPKVGPTEPGIHFGWFSVLAGIGVVVTCVAFWGPFVPNLGENAVAVWQSIFTNFGVGVFSAAVLLLFEPKIRRVITKTVSKTVTEEVTKDVREAVQADVEQRLASINDRIDSLYDDGVAARQSLAKNLTTNFTYDRAMMLFREASKISAIYEQGLHVQGDPDASKLLVGFQLRQRDGTRPFSEFTPYEKDEVLYIKVVPKLSYLEVEIPWDPEQRFEHVAIALAEGLQSNRSRGLAQKIDWDPILERLEKAMDVAINASMKTSGAFRLNGELYEYFEGEEDWYLTSAGIYCPGQDYMLSNRHFQAEHPRGQSSPDYSKPVPQLDAPSWARKSEWDYVFGQAKKFVRNSYP